MPYQIILEENAKEDIRKVVRWIAVNAEEDPFAKSAAWFTALQDALDSLSELSFRCPCAPENKFLVEEIRHLLFQKYRVVYTVSGNTVHVLHIRHQRQRPLRLDDF